VGAVQPAASSPAMPRTLVEGFFARQARKRCCRRLTELFQAVEQLNQTIHELWPLERRLAEERRLAQFASPTESTIQIAETIFTHADNTYKSAIGKLESAEVETIRRDVNKLQNYVSILTTIAETSAASRDRPVPVSVTELAWHLTGSWHRLGRAGLALCLACAAVALTTFLTIRIIRANTTADIVVQNGSLIFRAPGKRSTTWLLLSANGSDDGPWVNTQIELKKGQEYAVHASGRINVAMHRMMDVAHGDNLPPYPWIGPDGFQRHIVGPPYCDRGYDYFSDAFLLADAPYGSLIGMISPNSPNTATMRPGSRAVLPNLVKNFITSPNASFRLGAESRKQPAAAAGTLWLAVNEVWFTRDLRDLYVAHETGVSPQEIPAYRQATAKWRTCMSPMIQASVSAGKTAPTGPEPKAVTSKTTISGTGTPDVSACGPKPDPVRVPMGCKGLHKPHRDIDDADKQWAEQIEQPGYWNVWFDDNAGAFFVIVEVEPVD